MHRFLCAVSGVFDGIKELAPGFKLRGINSEVSVGYLTVLEALRLSKVGEHYKCPSSPIWVVGSEYHYTVSSFLSLQAVRLNPQSHLAIPWAI